MSDETSRGRGGLIKAILFGSHIDTRRLLFLFLSEDTYLLTQSSSPWPSDAYSPYIVNQAIDAGWLDITDIKG